MTHENKKPFLKWAGGKYKLVDLIRSQMPSDKTKCYVEPFVGAGSVFLNVGNSFDECIINDANRDLCLVYEAIKQDTDYFIENARTFIDKFDSKRSYITLRDEFNKTSDPHMRACLFLYLNRRCFNGLCRYNKKGEFNTSFGKYKTVYFPENEIRNFAEILKKATIFNETFESIMDRVPDGSVVYCDPPYVPLSNTSNFVGYSSCGFNNDNHETLAKYAEELSKNKNSTVIISNHDNEYTRELYKNADKIIEVNVQRSIGGSSDSRVKVKELIAVYN